jgi:hypothetical protein
MEFLVEFEIEVPEGTPEAGLPTSGKRLAEEGHVLRVWNRPAATGQPKAVLGSTRPKAKGSSMVCLAVSPCGAR